MSRYAFSYLLDGKCKLYAESMSAEDRLDLIPDEDRKEESCWIALDWTGNGWLAFWKRCMDMVREETSGFKGCGKMVFTDLWYDLERVIPDPR